MICVEAVKQRKLENILWSIAFPGFAQILNGKLIKGILFIFLEFFINVQSNFNKAILYSFHGKIQAAIDITNYQWLMFYPCVYLFAMWDGVKDIDEGNTALLFLPFAISAFFVTVGLIFSDKFTIGGLIFGPVWLPIMFLFIGLLIGFLIRSLLLKRFF